MKGMFEECWNLEALPDISNWNTSKVKNISKMFSNCCALNSFPDISKWDISNIEIKKRNVFNGIKNIFPSNIKIQFSEFFEIEKKEENNNNIKKNDDLW